MVEVIWSELALDDLEGIAEYIALDKPEAAVQLMKQVFQRTDLLEQTPELGPKIPELPRSARYRQLIVGPCRIFYRYDMNQEKVFIVGVMRGEKLFQHALLLERDLPPK
ncbi:MAG TPA: type II toxin-antitoxin system RelE/ParE family toxin [Verrucomicrobiae bacterium]